MKRFLLGMAAAFALLFMAGANLFKVVQEIPATNPNYSLPKYANHPYPHQTYLAPVTRERVGAIVLFFDDGNDDVVDYFKPLSDSIYNGDIGTGNGNRIKATTGIMPNSVGNAGKMTWAEIAACDQSWLEVALHGDSGERWGANMTIDGGGFTFAGNALDSMLADHQNQFVTNGVAAARTEVLANHRFSATLQPIFKKHGIYNVWGLGVSVKSSHGEDANERWGMERNCDLLPFWWASEDFSGATAAWETKNQGGFHRHGSKLNRWNLGRGPSYNNTHAALGGAMTAMFVAAHSREILTLTMHTVDPAEGADLAISYADLRTLCLTADTLMTAGLLESYTAEEAADAIMCDVTGNLLPPKFIDLSKVTAAADDSLALFNVYPVGWPTDDSFYLDAADEFVATGGAAAQPKMYNLQSDGDTVSAAIVAAGGDTEDETYGTADDPNGTGLNAWDGEIVVMDMTSVTLSNDLTFLIVTTGVQSPYIWVEVQCAPNIDAGTSMVLCTRMGQYREDWSDFITFHTAGDGADAYWFGDLGASGARTSYEDQVSRRTIPLFNPTLLDTTFSTDASHLVLDQGTAAHATGVEFKGEWARYYPWMLRPYFYTSATGNTDADAHFGNRDNIGAVGTGGKQILRNDIAKLDAVMDWTSFFFTVPIAPGMTDFVAGHVSMRASGGSQPSSTPIIMFTRVTAIAP